MMPPITLNDFIAKYSGKQVDFDGAFGTQCVDLFRQYCKEVWLTPHLGAVNGAQDLWNQFAKMPVMKKYLTQEGQPKEGDAVVFGPSKTNQYGHVAIVVHVEPNGLYVFEQDGFNQNLGAHFNTWKLDRVLGYLRRV